MTGQTSARPRQRRHSWPIWLASACLFLAACTGPIERHDSVQWSLPHTASVPGPILFEDCYEYALTFPVDMKVARRLLPEILEPARHSRAVADLPLGIHAELRVPVWTCQHSLGDRDLGAFWQAYIYLMVRSPEGFELESARGHSYMIAALADSQAMVEAYHAWGLPAFKLDEIAGVFSNPADPRSGPVRLSASAGDIEVVLEGALNVDTYARPRGATGSWRFLITDGGGAVTGAADLEWGDEATVFARGRGRLTYRDTSTSIETEEGTITYLGDAGWNWRLVYTPKPSTSEDANIK